MDTDDLNQRYKRARDLLAQSRQQAAEAERQLKALRPSVTNARGRGTLNDHIWQAEHISGARKHHFSQSGQDAFLDERVFNGKRGGTFVEIGGFDGITGSNCLFFELKRGWNGVLIEPSPTYFARASSFRRAKCMQLALADQAGEAEFLDVQEGYQQMSGLTASYDADLRKSVEDDPRFKGGLIRVKTQTLEWILDENGLPDIDFISLDVEGGEMAVLPGFPFDKYNITAWTIENNTAQTDVPDLMKARGYQRIEAIGVDDVYVKAEA